MTKFMRFLSVAWAIFALAILLLVARNFIVFVSTAYHGGYHGRAPLPVSILVFLLGGIASVMLTGLPAYFLAVARHRKAALILAAINCIGFPVGTVLGVLTLIALTRADGASAFHATI